ncbi:MAG: dephospho-CoA kinase [Alphaproteobacteria bacterium]
MIIAAVGMPGSGKSVFCDQLSARGVPTLYFGGQVLEEVEKRGLDRTQENERLVREDLRARLGMAAMAHLALPRLRELHAAHDLVGIDGLYSFSEYKVLKDEFGDDLVTVGIITPRLMRHDRLVHRPERPLTPEKADQRDVAEIEKIEKGGPIAIADAYILNDSSPEKYQADVEALLEQLTAGKLVSAR